MASGGRHSCFYCLAVFRKYRGVSNNRCPDRLDIGAFRLLAHKWKTAYNDSGKFFQVREKSKSVFVEEKIVLKFKVQNPKFKSMSSANNKIYDLEERTARFGEDILEFVRIIKKDDNNKIIINQLIRSSTSIGANYMEADAAESVKDFIHKMSISKKEAKESKHWLRMLAKITPETLEKCRVLWQETHELALIFSSIINKKITEQNRTE